MTANAEAQALALDALHDALSAAVNARRRVPCRVRRQLVGMLSAQGMSTRAIAPVVGVSQDTVVKVRAELEQVERFTTSA